MQCAATCLEQSVAWTGTMLLSVVGNPHFFCCCLQAGAGLAAGAIGALVGNPADLSLVRMQSDATLPIERRRNYTGVGNALSRIVKEEGVAGLFKGSGPTVTRAMALNMGMLVCWTFSFCKPTSSLISYASCNQFKLMSYLCGSHVTCCAARTDCKRNYKAAALAVIAWSCRASVRLAWFG